MYCRDRAKRILSAWGEGGQSRVQELLNSRGRAVYAISPDEQERRELLEGITAGLARHKGDGNEPAVAVSLRLLRHLAASCN